MDRRTFGLLGLNSSSLRNMALRFAGLRTFQNKSHEMVFRGALRGGYRVARSRRYDLHQGNGKRERQRRNIADAHLQQLNSHKPGTVQPRHIFGVQP